MGSFFKRLATVVTVISALSSAQTTKTMVVTVRVFDGPTGQPADAKKVHLFCRMSDGSVCPLMRRLETKTERKSGVARFEVPDQAATIYQYGSGAAECNFDPSVPAGPGGYATYDAVSLARIRSSGVLFQDKCKTSKTSVPPNVQPGELIVFYTGGYSFKAWLTGQCGLL
jgi:hypothetical protein